MRFPVAESLHGCLKRDGISSTTEDVNLRLLILAVKLSHVR